MLLIFSIIKIHENAEEFWSKSAKKCCYSLYRTRSPFMAGNWNIFLEMTQYCGENNWIELFLKKSEQEGKKYPSSGGKSMEKLIFINYYNFNKQKPFNFLFQNNALWKKSGEDYNFITILLFAERKTLKCK